MPFAAGQSALTVFAMENAPTNTPAPHFRYYDLVMAAFVTILLLSNLIGASKPSYVILPVIGEWSFGAGVLFFPVSYIIGDVLTEVYGYARARRVIWTGFAALLFMAFMAWGAVQLEEARPSSSIGTETCWKRAIYACSSTAIFRAFRDRCNGPVRVER